MTNMYVGVTSCHYDLLDMLLYMEPLCFSEMRYFIKNIHVVYAHIYLHVILF